MGWWKKNLRQSQPWAKRRMLEQYFTRRVSSTLERNVNRESLLGPRLFSMFTKRPPKLLRLIRSGNVCWRFHCNVIGDSIDSISTHIQTFCNNYYCMFIYPVKTEIMFVCNMPFIGPILPITFENNLINCVSHSLSSGVTLDNKTLLDTWH